MGKAEERREPTFPLSYWNDAGDIDLGPVPDRLKRPEQHGEEQACEEVASMAQTAFICAAKGWYGGEAKKPARQNVGDPGGSTAAA